MTREQIQDKMDRLLDDNHRCLQIMHDESSSKEDISEASYQLGYNCTQLAALQNQMREMDKDDAFHTIAERHIEAMTRIKESTETILANDQTAEEMLTDMGKDLEKLLGDSEQ